MSRRTGSTGARSLRAPRRSSSPTARHGRGGWPVPPEPGAARFGEVWTVKAGGKLAPRLVISGDRYASARPDMVLTAIVDAPPENPSYAPPASGFLGEEI